MTYYIHEANLEIPEECQDQSINIFSFPSRDGRGTATITVSRESLLDGNLDAFADHKLVEAAQQLQSYRLIERRVSEVGGERGVEFAYTWKTPDRQTVLQRQVMVSLQGLCLAFTLSVRPDDFDRYAATWQAFLDSIVFRDM